MNDSARTPPALWQLTILPLCGVTPLVLLWLCGADGALVCGAVLALAMTATVSLRILAVVAGLLSRHAAEAQALSENDPDLPRYSILVPLYHEAAVVPHLLESLAALRWPRDRFDAILLVEEDDAETQAALAAVALPTGIRVEVVPDGRPRTKPRACNHGLSLVTGDLVVVFDAEDRPEPDQLLRAAARFRAAPARVACLQARLQADHRGHGAPALGFAVDYAAWFDLYLPGLYAVGAPIPLGGTSNHFRTESLRAVGGWDAWNVTEDADLGVRLARRGLATAVIESTTWEEAPSQWGPWLRQRSRWMKGWWQTSLVHSRHPLELVRELGVWRTLWWLATIPGQVLAALAAPGCWLLLLVGWWRGWSLADPARPWTGILLVMATGLLLVNGIFMALTAMAAWRRGRYLGACLTPLLPAYWLAVSIATWRGILQFHSDPFRWEKTPHHAALAAVTPATIQPVIAVSTATAAPMVANITATASAFRWRRPLIAGGLVVLLAGIVAIAWTAPGWSGFAIAVDRRRIDLKLTPNVVINLAPDTTWVNVEELQATVHVAAPCARAVPIRLTFGLQVLDGTWFQYEIDGLIHRDSTSTTVSVPLHGHDWVDPSGSAHWSADWLRRVRSAGVRAWLPSGQSAALRVELTPHNAHVPAPLAILTEPLTAAVKRRQMTELHFHLNRAYDNPFDPAQIDAWAEITAPDGTARRAIAFMTQDYDRRMENGAELLAPHGEPYWAVRFTPSVGGKHMVEVHAHDQYGDTTKSEALTCEVNDGQDPGFVRVTGRWFSREDGSFLYPVPINLRNPYDSLLEGRFEQPEDRAGTEPYVAWLQRCGAAGINLVRPWIAPGFLGLEWNRSWRGYHGLGQYNLENAWRLDRLLQLAASNKVLVELAIWQHGPWVKPGEADSQWVDSPYRRDAGGPLDDPVNAPFDPTVRHLQLQQARYMAARWGANPTVFGWTLWIEIDAVSPYRSTVDWHRDLSSAMAEQSWGRQPVSSEYGRDDFGDSAVWNLPNIAYTQLGGYTFKQPSVINILPAITNNLSKYDKPAIIEEYGGVPGDSDLRLAQEIHDGLWASWGLDLSTAAWPWWWNLIFHYGLERNHHRFTAFIAGADLRGTTWKTGVRRLPAGGTAFMRIGSDRGWVWLRPAGKPPKAFDALAADPGAWFPADPARTVDLRALELSPGRWQVEIWDTWSESTPTVSEVTVGDGPVILPMPMATRDVALKLKRLPEP